MMTQEHPIHRYIVHAAVAGLLLLTGTNALAQGNPPRLDTMKVVETQKEPRSARNVLTLEEIERKNYQNVYEAIEGMRPLWLRVRGPTHLMGAGSAATPVKLFLDGINIGTVEELKGIDVKTIKRAVFLSGAEAQQRFGVGNENGAILLETIVAPTRKDP